MISADALPVCVDVVSAADCAILTLNRPDKLNALSFAVLEQIEHALDTVAHAAVRALIVTGAGPKAFCAGADIAELRGRPLADAQRGAERGQAVFEKIAKLPFISVAAIDGHALGGGLELALACTFRIATRRARMALPEIKLGLIPGYGGTQRLPRIIGEARALELILSGRTVGAEEAERIGLVNSVVEADVVEAALAFARKFTPYSRIAAQLARSAVSRALDHSIHEGLKVEAELSTLAYCSQDADEGMAAFLDKRAPVFQDA